MISPSCMHKRLAAVKIAAILCCIRRSVDWVDAAVPCVTTSPRPLENATALAICSRQHGHQAGCDSEPYDLVRTALRVTQNIQNFTGCTALSIDDLRGTDYNIAFLTGLFGKINDAERLLHNLSTCATPARQFQTILPYTLRRLLGCDRPNVGPCTCERPEKDLEVGKTDVHSPCVTMLVNVSQLFCPEIVDEQPIPNANLIGRCFNQVLAGIALLQRVSSVLRAFEKSMLDVNKELERDSAKYSTSTFLSGFRLMFCSALYPHTVPERYCGTPLCSVHCQSLGQMQAIAQKFALGLSQRGLLLQCDPLAMIIHQLSKTCTNSPNTSCLTLTDTLTPLILTPTTPSHQGSVARVDPCARKQKGQASFCLKLECPSPILTRTNISNRWTKDIKDLSESVYKVIQTAFPYFNGLSIENQTRWILPCGLSCKSTVFTESEEEMSRLIVKLFAWLVLFFTFFAIVSFILNRDKLNKFPTRLLFYINICYFIGNFGILFQQFGNFKDYVCNKDGTIRMEEPRDSPRCVVLFSLTYFFYISALLWWLALTQSWYITFKSFNHRVFMFYFKHLEVGYHFLIWTMSTIFLSLMLSNNYVDGAPLYGICFTSREEPWFNLMTIPVVIVGVLGLPFLALGSLKVWQFRKSMIGLNRQHGSTVSSKRRVENQESLRVFLIRLSFIIFSSFAHLLLQFAVAVYRKVNWDRWVASVQRQSICLMTNCCKDECELLSPSPSLPMFILLLVFIEMQGIIMTLWIFNKQTWQKWKDVSMGSIRLVRRLSSRESVTSNRSNTSSSDSGVTQRHTMLNARRIQRMSTKEFNLHYNVDDAEVSWKWSPDSAELPSLYTSGSPARTEQSELSSSPQSGNASSSPLSPDYTDSASNKREMFAKRGSRVTFSNEPEPASPHHHSHSNVHTTRFHFPSVSDLMPGIFPRRHSTASSKSSLSRDSLPETPGADSSPSMKLRQGSASSRRSDRLSVTSWKPSGLTPPLTPTSILKKRSTENMNPLGAGTAKSLSHGFSVTRGIHRQKTVDSESHPGKENQAAMVDDIAFPTCRAPTVGGDASSINPRGTVENGDVRTAEKDRHRLPSKEKHFDFSKLPCVETSV